jgi:hypothetical protein
VRAAAIILVLLLVLLAWAGVYYWIVLYDVGGVTEFWRMDRLLAYATFVLAPLLTFAPIARLLRIPLYDLEAIVAWSTLLFVITFVDPGRMPPLPVLLLFLVSLTMSLATLFTLISYAVGFRLLTRRSQRYDFFRARREGYLISIFLVGCLLLHLLEVLTWVNGALLALIVVLLEVFLLSRGAWSGPQPVSSGVGPSPNEPPANPWNE